VSKAIKIVLWVIVAFGALAIIVPTTPTDTNATTTSSSSSVEAQQPLETYSVSQIAKEYESNTVKADSKYKDKTFKLKALVEDINTGLGGGAYVSARGVNEFSSAQLNFVDENLTALGDLKKGQEIEVICTGAGDIIKAPMFNNCELQ
jgi:hypothetical protein